MAEIHIATNSFTTTVGGKTFRVTKGMTVRGGHPVLAGREHLFTTELDLEVEQPKKTSKKKDETPAEEPAE